jgi:hypothetical protein
MQARNIIERYFVGGLFPFRSKFILSLYQWWVGIQFTKECRQICWLVHEPERHVVLESLPAQ